MPAPAALLAPGAAVPTAGSAAGAGRTIPVGPAGARAGSVGKGGAEARPLWPAGPGAGTWPDGACAGTWAGARPGTVTAGDAPGRAPGGGAGTGTSGARGVAVGSVMTGRVGVGVGVSGWYVEPGSTAGVSGWVSALAGSRGSAASSARHRAAPTMAGAARRRNGRRTTRDHRVTGPSG